MSTLTLPEKMNRLLLDRIEGGKLELPVLPEAAGQVLLATMKEDPDPRELTVPIKRDQSLAGHVLRLANSPLYQPRTPIHNLDQAVARLGIRAIREIALLVSCKSRVFNVPQYATEVRDLFRHSLAAALYAQEISRVLRWDTEGGFMCGLLHDVGRPVLLQEITDLTDELGSVPDDDVVDDVCSVLHPRVGADLVKQWNLPESLAVTIRFHHAPADAPEEFHQAVWLTRLADDLGHSVVGPRTVERYELEEHPANRELELNAAAIEQLLSKREQLLSMVDALNE